MKRNMRQNGITLIALVITIIVLLILAGVALSVVFNGGLIDKSQNAVDSYGYASKNEADKLSDLERRLNEYFDGNGEDNPQPPEVDYDPQQLFTYEIFTTAKLPEEKIDGVQSVTKLADITGTIKLASNSESDSDSNSSSGSDSFSGGTIRITGYNYDYIFGDIIGYSSNGTYLGSIDDLTQRVKQKFSVIVVPNSIVVNGIECRVEQIYRLTENDTYGEQLRNNISQIYISNNVTSIGNYSFENYSSLEKIYIPNSVTSIGRYAFNDCSSLKDVTLPDNLTNIEGYIFNRCTNLKSVNIPNGVTNIGDNAFSYCTNLTNINIPNSVTRIGSSAFSNCKGFTNITIPNGVTSIGSSAFYSCDSLANITIPNSLTSIGSYAFVGCNNLQMINYRGTQEEWNNIIIETFNHSQDAYVKHNFEWYKNQNTTFDYSVQILINTEKNYEFTD